MLSSSPPQKRRMPHIPTPHELARLFKRPCLDPAPPPSNSDSPRAPPASDSTLVLPKLPDPLVFSNLPLPHLSLSHNYAPVLHSIPQGAFPILEDPYTVADFFSDVAPKGPHESQQHLMAAKSFPPPMPPPTSLLNVPNGENPGVMVPFVYPALPSLKFDPWTVYPEGAVHPDARKLFERNPDQNTESSHAEDPKVGVGHKRPKRRLTEPEVKPPPDDSHEKKEDSEPFSAVARPMMAPLPFPPPNFMPYPIMADRAPLIPDEVFASWIEASSNLPRIDMVLASAAGSIYDMHSQAMAEGLNTSKLDELLRITNLDRDSDASTARISDDDSSFADYLTYASNVDTSTVEDPFATPIPDNYLVVQSDSRIRALQVSQRTSKDGAVEETAEKSIEFEGLEETEVQSKKTEAVESDSAEVPPFEFPNNKDLVMPSGVQRSKRRQALAKMVTDLEDHEQMYRAEIYAQKKQQLLARLQSLQNCKITFNNDPSEIDDAELRDYTERRQAQRDEELLRLRATYNYEKLKNVLNFYQTSHRSYKAMNATMVNKLQKLRNFLEHQRQILDSATRTADSDSKNMRSRESEKLYSGFVEQEYGNEIKEEFRSAIAREEGNPLDQNKTFDASLFTKVYKGHEHSATVEDYMPLVTKEEFKLITGDAPAKTVNKDAGNKGKSARHQIFQSLLYDRVTSGSDTEAPVVKRRPGRRAAPKPTYGDEAKVSNDAALVAKIMKQFVGPGSANSEELVHDLESIGIETKWPVK